MHETPLHTTADSDFPPIPPAPNSTARARSIITGLIVFAIGFLMMWYVVSEPNHGVVGVSGNDSFYHLRMSSMLTEHGLLRTFPWLRFVYFRDQGDAFVSHHYGFHVLLLPFVKVSEWLTGAPLAGGRWAVCTFMGLNVLLFYGILRAGGVPMAWLWIAILFLLPYQFFTRHGYVRAIGPSLLFMLLIVWLILQRRALWTAVAAMLFNHVYLGAIMYTPVIVAAFAAACLLDREGSRWFPVRLVLMSAAGWAIGVLTFPYLGGMLEFLKVQVFGSGLSPDIRVGREWGPYQDVWWFTMHAGALLIIFTVATLTRFRLGPRLTADEMFLLLLNLGFFLLTLKSRRFIEYWPIFALLSAAFLSRPVVQALLNDTDSRSLDDATDAARAGPPGAGRDVATPDRRGRLSFVFTLVMVALVSAGVRIMWMSMRDAKLDAVWPLLGAGLAFIALALVVAEQPHDRRWRLSVAGHHLLVALAAVAIVANLGFPAWKAARNDSRLRFDLAAVTDMMEFLKGQSAPGAVVFTTDWDDFPLYFYHNTHNHYIVGLDPKFTHARRPALWARYEKLTQGEAPSRVTVKRRDPQGAQRSESIQVKLTDIRDAFDADFVITDRGHKALARQLAHDPSFATLIYPGPDYRRFSQSPYLVFRIHRPDDAAEQAATAPAHPPAD